MNVVGLFAGLGNQMFQYALYTTYKMQGKKVKMDKYIGKSTADETMKIEKCFDVDIKYINKNLSMSIWDSKHQKYQSFLHVLTSGVRRIVRDSEKFNQEVLNYSNCYLVGYWQSEKYFEDERVKEKLRHDFAIPKSFEKSETFKKLEQQINDTNSISLHIRRGDYLNHPDLYGNICTDDYYENAIAYIKERVENPTFFIFSDDKEYIKEKYGNQEGFVIANEEGDLRDIDEFFLMRNCKHNIMANSTFSWWSAWLNDSPDALKLAPERWFLSKDFNQIYTDEMIKIKI